MTAAEIAADLAEDQAILEWLAAPWNYRSDRRNSVITWIKNDINVKLATPIKSS